MSRNSQSPSQNVDEELLDFEVQSPVKVKEECSTHGSCDASNLRKVLDGGSGVKVEADAGLVTVEENALDNLEEGEISEEEVGESGIADTKGTKREEQATKQIVCRHFKAGSTCFWGQNCRFLHSKTSAWGNYSMFPTECPVNAAVAVGDKLTPVDEGTSPGVFPCASGGGGVHTKAWEEGLAKARRLKEISKKRRLEDLDYHEKREGLSIGQAELEEEADYCSVVRVEPNIVEDHEDLEDLILEQKISQAGVDNFFDFSLEEEVKAGGYRKPVEVQTGGYRKPEDVQTGAYVGLNSRDYVEALKRIADIEKELRGVEGQMLNRKRKFAN